jgi:hypothetical protein
MNTIEHIRQICRHLSDGDDHQTVARRLGMTPRAVRMLARTPFAEAFTEFALGPARTDRRRRYIQRMHVEQGVPTAEIARVVGLEVATIEGVIRGIRRDSSGRVVLAEIATTFLGSPCRTCGACERYAGNGACVACNRERSNPQAGRTKQGRGDA